MTDPSGSLVLRRSLLGRLLGGAKLQPLLTTLTVLVAVRLVGQAAGAAEGSPSIGITALVLIALAAATAVGASGYARADADGITWRYYARHHVRWDDVESVTLAITSAGVAAAWFTLDVRTRRRRLRVTPVRSAGPDRKPFAGRLLALAAARGCETRDDWR